MKILSDILYKVALLEIKGSVNIEVNDITLDSRKVKKGSLFIAIKGTLSDGHDFIEKAIHQQCSAVVAENIPDTIHEGITFIKVKNSSEAAGYIASNFFDNPSEKMQLVGVTGTNGKTTVATMLYNLFTKLGYACGLISTVQNIIVKDIIPATHTTPDPVSLNHLLYLMEQSGCSYVFMEVSSHAIHQHRITGLHFTGGIFTNITHDHLDYHGTFDEYIKVKKRFFDYLPATAFALSNKDDKRGEVMLQNTAACKNYFSLKSPVQFKAKIIENALTGLVLNINEKEVHFRLIGTFNAYNLLAVYGAAVLLSQKQDEVLTLLSDLTGAEGRFDYFISATGIIAIVDYAHTPDALENVLSTIVQLKKGNEKLITVVGCGGDRDKTKRPLMGEVSCRFSDEVIFTSDNPRSEDPEQILFEITNNLSSAAKRKSIVITNRKEAIKQAVSKAMPGDVVLVAGKGHEKYQEIKGVKHPFDDKEVLREMFQLYNK